jgi:hypothetical protein
MAFMPRCDCALRRGTIVFHYGSQRKGKMVAIVDDDACLATIQVAPEKGQIRESRWTRIDANLAVRAQGTAVVDDNSGASSPLSISENLVHSLTVDRDVFVRRLRLMSQ